MLALASLSPLGVRSALAECNALPAGVLSRSSGISLSFVRLPIARFPRWSFCAPSTSRVLNLGKTGLKVFEGAPSRLSWPSLLQVAPLRLEEHCFLLFVDGAPISAPENSKNTRFSHFAFRDFCLGLRCSLVLRGCCIRGGVTCLFVGCFSSWSGSAGPCFLGASPTSEFFDALRDEDALRVAPEVSAFDEETKAAEGYAIG